MEHERAGRVWPSNTRVSTRAPSSRADHENSQKMRSQAHGFWCDRRDHSRGAERPAITRRGPGEGRAAQHRDGREQVRLSVPLRAVGARGRPRNGPPAAIVPPLPPTAIRSPGRPRARPPPSASPTPPPTPHRAQFRASSCRALASTPRAPYGARRSRCPLVHTAYFRSDAGASRCFRSSGGPASGTRAEAEIRGRGGSERGGGRAHARTRSRLR